MDAGGLFDGVDWYAAGRPHPTGEEIKAGILAFATGIDSPQRFCARYAMNFDEIIGESAKAIQKWSGKHPLLWAQGGQTTMKELMTNPPPPAEGVVK